MEKTNFEVKLKETKELVTNLVIKNEQDFRLANDYIKKLNDYKKEVKAFMKPIVESAHKAHKEAKARENELVKPADELIAGIKKKTTVFHVEQERLRQEEEAKLRLAAKRQQEEHALKMAQLAEEAGEKEEAEEILEEAEDFVPVVNVESKTKQEGVYFVSKWKFEIMDETEIPRQFMIPDERKIREFVNANKQNAASILKGVRVWEEKEQRVRS